VGHADSLLEIKNVVARHFGDIEVFEAEFNDDDCIDAALAAAEKIINVCHGVLYTRLDPYRLISERLEHTIPARYIGINASNFILSLSKAMYRNPEINIASISVDTLGRDTIEGAYASLGIEPSSLKISIVDVDASASNFVHKAEEDHCGNYRNGASSLFVTSITAVYNSLRQKGIPCTLMAPTPETYADEIKHLIISHKLKKMNENLTVIACIDISPKDTFYNYSENQFQEIMEIGKAAEQIALFAQKLDGALVRASDSRFFVICGSMNIEALTNDFSNIELLSDVAKNTMFDINIGVGYGESIRAARKNAVIGVSKAANGDGSNAYVVYDQRSAIGPISAAFSEKSADPYSKSLMEIAENSALSANTVYRLSCIIKQKKTRNFTSGELAELMGVTPRTINRIVAKLEASGYIAQTGRQPIGLKGRPSRVLRFSL
jgi:hypothetical protein